MTVTFSPTIQPAGKLADAELVFTSDDGALAGLRLLGFAIWRSSAGTLTVTFPARSYVVNGERRSFALLRPTQTAEGGDALRAWILERWHAQQEGGEQ